MIAATRLTFRLDDIDACPSVRPHPSDVVLNAPVERFLVRPPVPKPVSVPADLPSAAEPRMHARRLLRLVLEVLDRRRPAAHVSSFVRPAVYRYVRAAVGRPGWRCDGLRLVTIRFCQPHEDAVEVAAVVRVGNRYRALAARLDRVDDQWRCSALRVG